MKIRENRKKFVGFYKGVSKQATLFCLVIAFINTILLPSLLAVVEQTNLKYQICAEPESASSLAEYLLEGCLHVYDSTSDANEDDVADLEKLYDEVDLLHHVSTYIDFQQGIYKGKKYASDKYPLRFLAFNSSTPPPESC